MKAAVNTSLKVLKTIAFPAIFLLILKLLFSDNIKWMTVSNLFYQAAAPAILAWGVLFNQKVGNWNFSVGATAMISAILGGNLAMQFGLGTPGLIVLCAVIGTMCGILNGILYTVLKIPTVIITMAVCMILEGISAIIYGGSGVFLPTAQVKLNTLQAQVIFGIAAMLIALLIYNYTEIGYHIRAIGNGPAIASQKGINFFRQKIAAMIIGGLFAGFYAALTVGSAGVYRAATSTLATMGLNFDAMMCVFVGMCLEKYSNLIISVYVGAVVLRELKLLLMLLGTQSFYDQLFVAVFILIFLIITKSADNKRAEIMFKHRILSGAK